MVGRVQAGGARRYYLKDHLGSIRAVLDGGGGVRETRDYYPFGLPMPGRYEKGSPPTKEDFTGHVKDEATGLHYAGARYYSSAFGRWTTTDPILREQSPAKLLKDGKVRAFSMSAYNYSFNNPVKFKDETGEYPTPWDIADFGAAAHSIYQAVQNPSASNIGWAAADVGAAALPLVPSTKGVRVAAKYGDDAIQSISKALSNGGKLFAGSGSRTTLEGVDQFMKRNANRINKKLGDKLDELSFGLGDEAAEKAREAVRETLENVSKVSSPEEAARSKKVVFDIYSKKTEMTVRIGAGTGEFRTLIEEATNKVE